MVAFTSTPTTKLTNLHVQNMYRVDLVILRTATYIPKNQDHINSSIILVLNVGTLYHSLSDMLRQLNKIQAPIKQNFQTL